MARGRKLVIFSLGMLCAVPLLAAAQGNPWRSPADERAMRRPDNGAAQMRAQPSNSWRRQQAVRPAPPPNAYGADGATYGPYQPAPGANVPRGGNGYARSNGAQGYGATGYAYGAPEAGHGDYAPDPRFGRRAPEYRAPQHRTPQYRAPEYRVPEYRTPEHLGRQPYAPNTITSSIEPQSPYGAPARPDYNGHRRPPAPQSENQVEGQFVPSIGSGQFRHGGDDEAAARRTPPPGLYPPLRGDPATLRAPQGGYRQEAQRGAAANGYQAPQYAPQQYRAPGYGYEPPVARPNYAQPGYRQPEYGRQGYAQPNYAPGYGQRRYGAGYPDTYGINPGASSVSPGFEGPSTFGNPYGTGLGGTTGLPVPLVGGLGGGSGGYPLRF